MKANRDKFQAIALGKRKQKSYIKVVLGNNVKNQIKKEVKFLGVAIVFM